MPRNPNSARAKLFCIHLGKIIRRNRMKVGLKAESLAHDIGLTPQAVSAIELGRVVPTISTLLEIAVVLEIPFWTLAQQASVSMAAKVFAQSAEAIRQHKRDNDL